MIQFFSMLIGCIIIMIGFSFWLGLGLMFIFWSIMLQNVRIAKIQRDNLVKLGKQITETLKEGN